MTEAGERVLLAGVPRLHFYEGGPNCPEDIAFPSAMRALLEFLGDKDFGCKHCPAKGGACKVSCTYSFAGGVSGAAFLLSWSDGWDYESGQMDYLPGVAGEPYRRAFQAAGYGCDLVRAGEGEAGSEAALRRRLAESLKGGTPVLFQGIVGPPEWGIIGGYDEGGDVLMGWSFFQAMPEFSAGLEYEPSGEFRLRGWFKPGTRFLFLGQKAQAPAWEEAFLSALRFGLQAMRTPSVAGRHNGLAGFDAWAQALEQDDWAGLDEAALRQRTECHTMAVGYIAEARWYGNGFLTQAAENVHYKLVENLLHAAACFAGEHELMWQLWDLAGGNGNPQAHKYLADPAVRQQLAAVVRACGAKDAEAAGYIERALAK